MSKVNLKSVNKYDKIMMNTAIIWSQESYAERLKVGAVLSKDGRVLLTGYNGTISGLTNKCEYSCLDCNGEGLIYSPLMKSHVHCENCQGTGKRTKATVLHAEQNIIVWAAKKGITTEGTTMYITHAPCIDCSKLIAGAGIKRVVYGEDYRGFEGINFLKEIRIEVVKFN